MERDRALVRQLSSELKAELTQALSVSAVNAIEVCNERAPQIAGKISREHEVTIGRTALRTRNPANAPAPWQQAALEAFQRRSAPGEPLAAMEYSETVELNGRLERRYMKAIGMEPMCVTCHGAQLTPELQAAIAARYPQDQATGFDVGELRGAAYVIRRESAATN